MIEWTTRKKRSHVSDADISIRITKRFVRFVFRNQCKQLLGNEKQIAIGIDGNRVYFKVGDDTLDRFTLSDYSSNNKTVALESEDRIATYKRFDGDYTVKVTDEAGLFYIEKN